MYERTVGLKEHFAHDFSLKLQNQEQRREEGTETHSIRSHNDKKCTIITCRSNVLRKIIISFAKELIGYR